MKHQEEDDKQRILDLIAKIDKHALGLLSVLWSQEELMLNKEYLNSSSQRIDDTLKMIPKNFYWYKKIGWKKFLLNPEEVEAKFQHESSEDEKQRFQDWLTACALGMDFYRAFHRLIKQEVVVDALTAHGHHLLNQPAILDVGCRDGYWLQRFLDHGIDPERLAGIEPSSVLYTEARKQLDLKVQVENRYPDHLPFADKQFDVILVFGILMTVLDEGLRQKVGTEFIRVLSNDGIILLAHADESFVNTLDPYLAYAMQAFKTEELGAIFPMCHLRTENFGTFTLTIVTNKGSRLGQG